VYNFFDMAGCSGLGGMVHLNLRFVANHEFLKE